MGSNISKEPIGEGYAMFKFENKKDEKIFKQQVMKNVI